MNNKNKAVYSILIGIAIIGGIFIGQVLNFNQNSNVSFSLTKKDKIDNLLRYIDEEYVDNISTDSIVDMVVKDILQNLDPHSVYIPPKKVDSSKEEIEGEFTGIGVVFQNYKDTFTVIRPLPNSPAKKAGLLPMDRILIVEKDTIYGKRLYSTDISKIIKGKENSKIKITIYRKSLDSIFDLILTRKKIPKISVAANFMVNDTLGFIKLTSFTANTYDEFDTALKNLIEKGMKTLVLDLRDNPGGLLNQADLIADEFLKNGKIIFFTKNKTEKINKNVATARGRFENGNIYVLLNENSASASEVVAGALQDNDKAIIVGRRSYGKGLVQREMKLGDGSKVRLVTARYYTPSGRSIQRPYKIGQKNKYKKDFEDRQYSGELYYKDSIPIIDSLKYTTPKGKIVYGGGGIIPDIFVPLDKNDYLFKYTYLNRYLSNSITAYLDENLKELQQINEIEFIENDEIGSNLYNYFTKNHGKKTRKKVIHNNKKGKENLKQIMKALLARDLFGYNTYYKILSSNDPMLLKIKSLSKKTEENNDEKGE